MRTETFVLNKDRNVTLTAYLQDVGGEFDRIVKRPAMLVLPGGGYAMCSEREADPVAFQYIRAGYQTFVLRYSVGEFNTWPNPLNDFDAAMEMIRANADEWHIYPNKIATIGFSAGGHLAAAAATMAVNRPNAALMGYAVAGNDVKMCVSNAPDTTLAVDKNTCPCFIFHSRTDNMVLVDNSVQFMQALLKHDISFESHIYAFGPHGFSTCDPSVKYGDTPMCGRIKNWVSDSLEWLQEVFGTFGDKEMTTPRIKAKINGDTDEFLSLECTIGKLLDNEESCKLVQPLLEKAQVYETLTSGTLYGNLLRRMKGQDILGFMGGGSVDLSALGTKICAIRNTEG